MAESESSKWEPLDGLPAVAAFIARDPDQETFVFRKFKRLTARALLHLQAELIDLEHQLDALDREAVNSFDEKLLMSMRDWEEMKMNAGAPDRADIEGKRKRLYNDIEALLRRYHELLVLESGVAKLESPSKRVLAAYLNDFRGGPKGMDYKLGGRCETMLDDRNDLVALKGTRNKDWLSNALLNHWPFPTKDLRVNKDEAAKAQYFDERMLVRCLGIFSVVVAAILLIGSILTLYFVRKPGARLGLVIMFIVLFAVALGLMTSANRDSVFGGTAAYAAVLVVFVSGNLGNS